MSKREKVLNCPACGRTVARNESGNAVRHMRPEPELAWRVCTPSARLGLEADAQRPTETPCECAGCHGFGSCVTA